MKLTLIKGKDGDYYLPNGRLFLCGEWSKNSLGLSCKSATVHIHNKPQKKKGEIFFDLTTDYLKFWHHHAGLNFTPRANKFLNRMFPDADPESKYRIYIRIDNRK